MSVHFEIDDRVALVTIDRPDQRNAIDGETSAALEDAFETIDNDPAIWCAIITATGDYFGTGADLKAVELALEAGHKSGIIRANGGFAGLIRRQRKKPLIAAVNGPALAGGFEIALACDMIVAPEGATFSLPEVKRCVIASGGALIHLPRLIGLNRTMELLLTGISIDAQQAKDWGIVNRIVAPDQVLPEARKLARDIAANAPLAVQVNMALARHTLSQQDAELWQAGFQANNKMMQSDDAKEGIRAFIEKRPPVWQGR